MAGKNTNKGKVKTESTPGSVSASGAPKAKPTDEVQGVYMSKAELKEMLDRAAVQAIADVTVDQLKEARPELIYAIESDLRSKILTEAEEALKEAPAAASSLGNERFAQAIKELGVEGNVFNIVDCSDGRVCIVTNDGRKLYWPVG